MNPGLCVLTQVDTPPEKVQETHPTVPDPPAPSARRAGATPGFAMMGTLFFLMLSYFLPVATAVTTSTQFLESITAQVHTGLGAAAVPKGLAVLHSHKVFMPLVFNIGHHEFIPDAIKTPDWSKICPKWSNGSCFGIT